MYEVSLYKQGGKQFAFSVFATTDRARLFAVQSSEQHQAQIVNTLSGETVIYSVVSGQLTEIKRYVISR
jgi:ribosomal protein L18